MKKRIFSFVLFSAMLLSLCLFTLSCGENSKINSAIEKTRDLDSMNADVYIAVDGYLGSDYISTDIKQAVSINGGRATISITKGDEKPKQVVFDGESVRVTENGKSHTENAQEYMSKNGGYKELTQGLLISLHSSFFEDSEYEASGNKQQLELSIEEGLLPNVYSELWESILTVLASRGHDVKELVAGKCDVSISTYDGYATRIILDFTLDNSDISLDVRIGLYVSDPQIN